MNVQYPNDLRLIHVDSIQLSCTKYGKEGSYVNVLIRDDKWRKKSDRLNLMAMKNRKR